MTTNEKDRLDLRQGLERVLSDPRLAAIAMEAMPPIDYSQLATKSDLVALGLSIDGRFAEVDGHFAQVEGRFAEVEGRFAQIEGRFTAVEGKVDALDGKIDRVHGALDLSLASQLRMMFLMQLGTIAAVTGIIQASL